MHKVLVNRLGGLSLPRKSVVRLTDRPDMTLDVYRGRKTTMQPTKPNMTIDIYRDVKQENKATTTNNTTLYIFTIFWLSIIHFWISMN